MASKHFDTGRTNLLEEANRAQRSRGRDAKAYELHEMTELVLKLYAPTSSIRSAEPARST